MSLISNDRKAALQNQADINSMKVHERVIELSVDKLIKHDDYQMYSIDDIQVLAESIQLSGQTTPIIVTKSLDGNYTIVSGHRRCEALKFAGIELAKVIIREYDTVDDMNIDFIISNQYRTKTALEIAEEFEKLIKLYKSKGYESPIMLACEKLNLSRRTGERFNRYNNLEEDEKAQVKEIFAVEGNFHQAVQKVSSNETSNDVLTDEEKEQIRSTKKIHNMFKYLNAVIESNTLSLYDTNNAIAQLNSYKEKLSAPSIPEGQMSLEEM